MNNRSQGICVLALLSTSLVGAFGFSAMCDVAAAANQTFRANGQAAQAQTAAPATQVAAPAPQVAAPAAKAPAPAPQVAAPAAKKAPVPAAQVAAPAAQVAAPAAKVAPPPAKAVHSATPGHFKQGHNGAGNSQAAPAATAVPAAHAAPAAHAVPAAPAHANPHSAWSHSAKSAGGNGNGHGHGHGHGHAGARPSPPPAPAPAAAVPVAHATAPGQSGNGQGHGAWKNHTPHGAWKNHTPHSAWKNHTPPGQNKALLQQHSQGKSAQSVLPLPSAGSTQNGQGSGCLAAPCRAARFGASAGLQVRPVPGSANPVVVAPMPATPTPATPAQVQPQNQLPGPSGPARSLNGKANANAADNAGSNARALFSAAGGASSLVRAPRGLPGGTSGTSGTSAASGTSGFGTGSPAASGSLLTAAAAPARGATNAAGRGTGRPSTASTPAPTRPIGDRPASALIQYFDRIVPQIPKWIWLALGASLALAAVGGISALLAARRVRRHASQFAAVTAAALTDPLTGLLNRRGFLEAFERELARARRYNRQLVLAYVDVRGLKAVNDTEGHLAGDELLRSAAILLSESARADDVVGRIGGDEMALLLAEQGPEGADAVIRRIVDAVPDRRAALSLRSSWDLTIGTASFPRDGSSATELLAAADRRLYEQRGIALR